MGSQGNLTDSYNVLNTTSPFVAGQASCNPSAGAGCTMSSKVKTYVQPGNNTGNGSVAGALNLAGEDAEVWTLTAINSTTFQVAGSVSGAQANASIGVGYKLAGEVAFTLFQGATPFSSGDSFVIDFNAPHDLLAKQNLQGMPIDSSGNLLISKYLARNANYTYPGGWGDWYGATGNKFSCDDVLISGINKLNITGDDTLQLQGTSVFPPGYSAGTKIVTAGFANSSNNKVLTIANVTGNTLTVSEGGLTNDTDLDQGKIRSFDCDMYARPNLDLASSPQQLVYNAVNVKPDTNNPGRNKMTLTLNSFNSYFFRDVLPFNDTVSPRHSPPSLLFTANSEDNAIGPFRWGNDPAVPDWPHFYMTQSLRKFDLGNAKRLNLAADIKVADTRLNPLECRDKSENYPVCNGNYTIGEWMTFQMANPGINLNYLIMVDHYSGVVGEGRFCSHGDYIENGGVGFSKNDNLPIGAATTERNVAGNNQANKGKLVEIGDKQFKSISATIAERWILKATSSTTFSVIGSKSGPKDNAMVGTEYNNGYVKFKITSGSESFDAGDEFVIEMHPQLKNTYEMDQVGSGQYWKCTVDPLGAAVGGYWFRIPSYKFIPARKNIYIDGAYPLRKITNADTPLLLVAGENTEPPLLKSYEGLINGFWWDRNYVTTRMYGSQNSAENVFAPYSLNQNPSLSHSTSDHTYGRGADSDLTTMTSDLVKFRGDMLPYIKESIKAARDNAMVNWIWYECAEDDADGLGYKGYQCKLNDPDRIDINTTSGYLVDNFQLSLESWYLGVYQREISNLTLDAVYE